MAEQFLDGPDVVAVFEQVSGEAMAQRVEPRGLGEAGAAGGFLDGFLDRGIMNVVAADLSRPALGVTEFFFADCVRDAPFSGFARARVRAGNRYCQLGERPALGDFSASA